MKIVIVTNNRCCTGVMLDATPIATAAAAPPSTRSARLELTFPAAVAAARFPDDGPLVERRVARSLRFRARLSTPLIRTLRIDEPRVCLQGRAILLRRRPVPAERFVAHAAAVREKRGDVSRRRGFDRRALGRRQRDPQRIKDL